MARITVEDCLQKENNRFSLVLLASKRTKQLLNGAKVLISDARGNKALVTSLREIAAGEVRFMTAQEKEEHEKKMAEIAEREAQAAAAAPAPQSLADVGASLFRTEPTPAADTNGHGDDELGDVDDEDDDDDDVEELDDADDDDDDDDDKDEESEESPKSEGPKEEE